MIELFGARLVVTLVNLFVGVAVALIGLRILLKLLAARPAPFVTWVYDTSDSLLSPFAGMFPSPVVNGGSVLEFSALFALVAYTLVGYLLVELVVFVGSGLRVKKK